MSDEIAIKVEGVSKDFKLPHEKTSSIKGALINTFSGKRTFEVQHALKDINFEVKKGEFFGIVGRNGSGKSTLLKLIAGIYTPTKGNITVNGKLTPFIELGVGFNPELTGRDNVFLNGALLGFNRKQMDAMYDEIVAFAELEKFMDQKLKNYSSGMQVRLAFSIAIRAKSDILVLDEVLAVGDAAFQKKCFDYFGQLRRDKTTVILVTHDMNAVKKHCDTALLILDGVITERGSAEDVAYKYLIENQKSYMATKSKEPNKEYFDGQVNVALKNKSGKNVDIFQYGDTATLKITWKDPLIKNIGVALFGENGEYVFGANTIVDKYLIESNTALYKINLKVGSGSYRFKIGFFGDNDQDVIFHVGEGPSFSVEHEKNEGWEGITKLNHTWGDNV